MDMNRNITHVTYKHHMCTYNLHINHTYLYIRTYKSHTHAWKSQTYARAYLTIVKLLTLTGMNPSF